MKKQVPKRKYKFLRVLAKILLGLVIFIILLLLFLRSPWGQGILVNEITSYISNKTNSKVEVENLFVTPSGNIKMEGLYMEDENGDTLIYSEALEADVPLWQIINGNEISVDNLNWTGLRANIVREDSINGFNYQFLLDAFASVDTTATASDTTGGGMEIHLGKMNFNDFDIDYEDKVTGTKMQADIGALYLEMQEMNLDSLEFHIGTARLSNSDINYSLTKAGIPTEDSTAAPSPFFSIDELEVNRVSANYFSAPAGISLDVEIDKLQGDIQGIDVADQEYRIGSALVSNSKIDYRLEEGIESAGDTTSAPKPFLSIEEIELAKVSVNYASVPDGISAEFNFSQLSAAIPDIDMQQQNVQIKNISFSNSKIAIETATVDNSSENKKEEVISAESGFQWPEWKVAIGKIALKNNKINYVAENSTSKNGNFNPNFLVMEDVTLLADNFYLKDAAAGVQLEKFVFREASGLNLEQFSGNLELNNAKLALNDLIFQLNDNSLAGNMILEYNSISDLMEHPENTRINANIPTFELWLKDIFQFQPQLR
ncbi:MAG TPA: hypothetical protein VFM59_05030, partial [Salinimicrobium sp.]|nr:hypothetical protein [Salinimicrobium sp.]